MLAIDNSAPLPVPYRADLQPFDAHHFKIAAAVCGGVNNVAFAADVAQTEGGTFALELRDERGVVVREEHRYAGQGASRLQLALEKDGRLYDVVLSSQHAAAQLHVGRNYLVCR